ncbi:hypothetical protein LUZ60_008257 [Juncus effusus]|nr:hypothetical protein LUZ60_008257 [Juncus effusus]
METITYGTNAFLFRFAPRCTNISQNPNFSKVFFSRPTENPNPRLKISNLRKPHVITACLKGENTINDFDSTDNSSIAEGPSIDIKLPRRSLQVQFTCDSCGERTSRLINRVAYEKGTVFLQCGGCQVYHKFVDNLGLIVEYDLREEQGQNSD